jgi:4-hydroxy-3-polyprenylbenzoate decarboxylase
MIVDETSPATTGDQIREQAARQADDQGRDFDDLREFLALVDEDGELRRFDGADWMLEIGAINEAMSQRRGPMCLFDEIKGYPKGYRVSSNPFTSYRRTARVLRLPVDLGGVDLLNAWREKIRNVSPIEPVEVADGPVFEHSMTGEAIDLAHFPVPQWNELDGGRFIGTGTSTVTRDPDEGWVNVGTYRNQVMGRDLLGILAVPGKHGRIHIDKYHARGEAAPVCVSVGHDPTVFVESSYSVGAGTPAYGFAGWLRGRPLEVVPSPIHGLPISATAEIVIEGVVPPPDQQPQLVEGPFGEWPGYYAYSSIGETPIMQVQAIYHRSDPIIFGAPHVKAPAPTIFAVPLHAATIWDDLERAGIPNVKGVWRLGAWGGGAGGMFTVVAIKQTYAGHAKQAAALAMSTRAGAYGGRYVVVVDEDIDITDADDVIWAMCTRSQAHEIDIVRGIWTSPTDPVIPPNERGHGMSTSSRAIIDACRPYEWLDEFPKVNQFSPEKRREVRAKWGLD